MTLLAEIQEVIERTYDSPGALRINLEDFLIGPSRSAQLYSRSGLHPSDQSGQACTFLRPHDGSLYVAIYYSPRLIGILEEENPRDCISHRNIGSLISFIEEITHALHAIWAFRQGFRRFDSEAFACGLEAQAKVDSYWLLLRFLALLTGKVPEPECKTWILSHLDSGNPEAYHHRSLGKRYQKASELALRFIQAVDPLPPAQKIPLIRRFRNLSFLGKQRLVRGL